MSVRLGRFTDSEYCIYHIYIPYFSTDRWNKIPSHIADYEKNEDVPFHWIQIFVSTSSLMVRLENAQFKYGNVGRDNNLYLFGNDVWVSSEFSRVFKLGHADFHRTFLTWGIKLFRSSHIAFDSKLMSTDKRSTCSTYTDDRAFEVVAASNTFRISCVVH